MALQQFSDVKGHRKRLLIQILTLVVVALGTGAAAIGMQHRSEIRQERSRLAEVAGNLARLLEASYENHLLTFPPGDEPGAFQETLDEFGSAQATSEGFGTTGEVVVAERVGDSVLIRLAEGPGATPRPSAIPVTAAMESPVALAIAGEEGSLVTEDLDGVEVLAAFEPVAIQGRAVGLVVKVDLAEVRRPMISAALRAGLAALVLIVLGGVAVNRLGEPAIQALARRELDRAMEWQEATIEGARDAIFISDQESRFVLVNQAASELTGYTRAELLEMTIPDLHEAMDLDAYRRYHKRILAGESALTEADVLRKDGTKVPTEFNNRRITLGEQSYMHSVARDLSERRAWEEAVASTEERFRKLFESMQEGFALHEMIWDEEGEPKDYRFLEVNPAFEVLTGLEAREVVGRTFREVLPNAKQVWLERYAEVVRSGLPTTFDEHSPTIGRYFRVTAFPSAPDRFATVFFDVTETRVSEERLRSSANRLRALAARLSRVREDERRSLARELHDVVGPVLNGLRMDVDADRSALSSEDPEARRRLTDYLNTIDEAMDLIKGISSQLRSPVLEVMGLGPAIAWVVEEQQERSSVRFHLDLPESGPQLPDHQETALFRVAQEAILNLLRHSQAENGWITLGIRDGTLVLKVEDDGIGLPPREEWSEKSLGLVGLEERVASLGGELFLGKRNVRGTVVKVRIPV